MAARVRLPNANLHAVIHVTVENQPQVPPGEARDQSRGTT
jgi:hypothetical protein